MNVNRYSHHKKTRGMHRYPRGRDGWQSIQRDCQIPDTVAISVEFLIFIISSLSDMRTCRWVSPAVLQQCISFRLCAHSDASS
jgi:hypothetical protein